MPRRAGSWARPSPASATIPDLRVAILTGGGREILLPGLGPQGGGGGRVARCRLWRRRLRRLAGTARPQQAGHRRGQRPRLRRRLRDHDLGRHHHRRRARDLRAAGDQFRHARRRRDHQAAAPHSLSRGDGDAVHRPPLRCGGGQALGHRQRDRARCPISCRAPASSPRILPMVRRSSSPPSRRRCAKPCTCRSSRPSTW